MSINDAINLTIFQFSQVFTLLSTTITQFIAISKIKRVINFISFFLVEDWSQKNE